jgi:putative phosphoesterase
MTLKIGIISDTHDNIWNIQKAVKLFNKEKIDVLVHCGDIVAPATVKFFDGIKAKKLIFIKGNNDGDIQHLKMLIEELGGKFYTSHADFTVKDKKLGAIHSDNWPALEGMINSKKYDYVFHGHTHIQRNELIEKTRVINPGAHYFHSDDTVVILDIDTDDVKFVKLK